MRGGGGRGGGREDAEGGKGRSAAKRATDGREKTKEASRSDPRAAAPVAAAPRSPRRAIASAVRATGEGGTTRRDATRGREGGTGEGREGP